MCGWHYYARYSATPLYSALGAHAARAREFESLRDARAARHPYSWPCALEPGRLRGGCGWPEPEKRRENCAQTPKQLVHGAPRSQ